MNKILEAANFQSTMRLAALGRDFITTAPKAILSAAFLRSVSAKGEIQTGVEKIKVGAVTCKLVFKDIKSELLYRVGRKRKYVSYLITLEGIFEGLNTNLTFANFICSAKNRKAFQTCQKISRKIEEQANVGFICGPTSSGKTHLLNAIGNEFQTRIPSAKVYYCTSTEFCSRFIDSVRHNNSELFREHLTRCDVLLVDDFQDLETKEFTQKEFRIVLDVLVDCGKSVIVAADRPPDAICSSERLTSRLLGGYVVALASPSEKDKLNYLKKMAPDFGVNPNSKELEILASKTKAGMREIIGSLKNLQIQKELGN